MNKQFNDEWEIPMSLKEIIFNLNKENFLYSINSIVKKFDDIHSISYNLIISQMIYYAIYISKMRSFDLYMNFLREIEIFEENNNKHQIFDTFTCFLFKNNNQESNFILEYMIEHKLLEVKIVKVKKNPYFVHYIPKNKIEEYIDYSFMEPIKNNYEELSKNDWALHKQLIKEGVNANEITKIIRNYEIEKLQEISSQIDFSFNQTIKPSLYERCSFINQDNVTLIDYAAFFGSVKCFKFLLMNGAKVKYTGKYAVAGGNEEIIHLCEQNHSSFAEAPETAIQFHRNKIFKYIYENKLEEINDELEHFQKLYIIGGYYKFGKIILEELGAYCILYYNYEIFTFLLEEGMKINDDIINASALIGNLYLVKYFLQNNQIPTNILAFSSGSGNIELVKYILEQEGIDINAKCMPANEWGKTALLRASKNGHTEIVKLLLEQEGIDINAKDNYRRTSLIFALQKGYIEIVKLLLEQEGIDVNVITEDYQRTALFYASAENYVDIVKLLLKKEGIDLNIKDRWQYTALMYASSNGYTEIVKLLLEHGGIDVNAKDKRENTALILASQNGNIEIVKLLLDHEGTDINIRNISRENVLTVAVKKNYIEIVKLLLEQKRININAKDILSNTVLIYASKNGYIEIVKLLLEQKRININAKDWYGNTALIYASKNGYIEIVKLLLEHKRININIKNNEGFTALMLASENCKKEIIELFQNVISASDHENI